MGRSARETAAGTAAALPPSRAAHDPTPRSLQVDSALVVDVLGRLAAAASSTDVAAAGLPLLLELPGVRGAAVVVRDGHCVVVLGSGGYDCGPMSPGGVFPLDAGLPMTEAVRTRRLVVQGSGPSWIAAPFGGGMSGALLLSLEIGPPQEPEQLHQLSRIARAIGDGLRRAGDQEQAMARLVAVSDELVLPVGELPGWQLATRSLPFEGAGGGDVVLTMTDEQGGAWLLAADVCGMGLAARLVARTVHAAFSALAPWTTSPAELLSRADRALRTTVGAGRFVTAVAARVAYGQVQVASAGHPAPLLLGDGPAVALDVEPGPPLALELTDAGGWSEAVWTLPADAMLLLHTDGLTDRRRGDTTQSADPLDLLRDRTPGEPEQVVAAVLAAAERLGAAADDVSLLVARPLG